MKKKKPKNRCLLLYIALIGFASIFFPACVSINPSTVQLSTQVGERLGEMEKLHQLAIQRYFDMEKQKVEDFLTNKWEPQFLKNFLGTSQVLSKLQIVSTFDEQGKGVITTTIGEYLEDQTEAERAANELISRLDKSRSEEDTLVRNVLTRYIEEEKLDAAVIHVSSVLGTDEPARIIFEFAEAAHQVMLAQRKELLAPIELAERQVMADLSGAYAELIRGQSTITGRLEAASRMTKQQDLLLDKLGVAQLSEDIKNRLAGLSSSIDQAIILANSSLTGTSSDTLGEVLKTLQSELDKIPKETN